jgi:hypothetical protein
MSILKPRRSRRVEPLKDSDYDHEINLLDHSPPASRIPSSEAEAPRTSTSGPSVEAEASSPNRRPRTPDRTTSAGREPSGLRSPGGNAHVREPEVPALEVERKQPILRIARSITVL